MPLKPYLSNNMWILELGNGIKIRNLLTFDPWVRGQDQLDWSNITIFIKIRP